MAPPRAAGYSLEVGSAAVITVVGNLVDGASDEPISLILGSATLLDSSLPKAVEFFTNRSGKFAISGVEPGDYLVELNTVPKRQFALTIPADAGTFHRVGSIRVP